MNRTAIAALLVAGLVVPISGPAQARPSARALEMPWREAGWTARGAAALLLDRLAFGARPGDVDAVLQMGLEAWVERQLAASLPEPTLARRLDRLPALSMSTAEIAATYPPGFALRNMAIEAGVIDREAFEAAAAGERGGAEAREARRKVAEWMRSEGYRPERELLAQSHAAKLLRAVYAENQLAEVLADFWFNHFNVSLTDPPVRQYLLSYERDAIRPRLLGRFRDLLGATAKHPAMLLYLDNFQSVAAEGQPTTLDREVGRSGPRGGLGGSMGGRPGRGRMGAPGAGMGPDELARRLERRKASNPNRPQGLNENYARELLELHTLGVDGGYDQHDVVEVARAFTGWALLPPGERGDRGRRGLEAAQRAGGLGFVRQGDFVFRADAHDAGEKRVLGVTLPAGRGLEDGEQVLDLLAAHPATARHLARKIAVRFVSDAPPDSLVDRLALAYERSGGDLARVMRTLVESPEFWDPAARTAKIKSPFEVAVSALRALGAEIENPFPTVDWISRMGQPLYAYQAPTGFPDGADFWVNTGALLARMNFGLELAAGRVPGVSFDLETPFGPREPESAKAALAAYASALLPERDASATVMQLEPLLDNPELAGRIASRAPPDESSPGLSADDAMAAFDSAPATRPGGAGRLGERDVSRLPALAALFPPAEPMARAGAAPSLAADLCGLILGSPEFQRR